MIPLKVRRIRHSPQYLPLPRYQSTHAAGLDLMADLDRPVILEPGRRALIPTGIAIELPMGYEAQVRPRSGLAIQKGIALVNAPGTIDADYRGEIKVILINLGQEPVELKRGDRIAQMVVSPVAHVTIEEVSELGVTQRSINGFGSTG